MSRPPRLDPLPAPPRPASSVFEQALLAATHEHVVTFVEAVALARAGASRGTRIVLEPGAPVVWFTYPGRWYDVGRFHLARRHLHRGLRQHAHPGGDGRRPLAHHRPLPRRLGGGRRRAWRSSTRTEFAAAVARAGWTPPPPPRAREHAETLRRGRPPGPLAARRASREWDLAARARADARDREPRRLPPQRADPCTPGLTDRDSSCALAATARSLLAAGRGAPAAAQEPPGAPGTASRRRRRAAGRAVTQPRSGARRAPRHHRGALRLPVPLLPRVHARRPRRALDSAYVRTGKVEARLREPAAPHAPGRPGWPRRRRCARARRGSFWPMHDRLFAAQEDVERRRRRGRRSSAATPARSASTPPPSPPAPARTRSRPSSSAT